MLVALNSPQDALDAIQGIKDALDSGLIAEARIDDSVRRILAAKQRTSDGGRLAHAPLKEQCLALGTMETLHVIDRIAARSVCALATPPTGFPLTQRPLELVEIVIGRCQARAGIRPDPWHPWHPSSLPRGVSCTTFGIEPGETNLDRMLPAVADKPAAVVALVEADELAVDTLKMAIETLQGRETSPVLLLAVPPAQAQQLAGLGWASLWAADMRQACRNALMSVILGQTPALGELPVALC